MKYLQCYKKQILILWCLVTFPFANWGQSAYRETGSLRWDYSGSRVERSLNGDSLVIELTVSPSVKLRGQEMVYIFPRVCLGRRERVCRIGSVLYIRQETI